MNNKQSLLYKISYCSLFTALTIILSRFFSIPGLFGLPFLKISFANSIVLFSSFYLGPIWGLIVGGLSDTLGAIFFPQGGAYNPIYTIPALLTGLFPFIFYKLFTRVKLDKKFPISLSIILLIFSLFVTFVLIFNSDIKSGNKIYHFTTGMKVTFILLSFGLSIGYVIISYILKNKFKNKKIVQNYDIFSLITSMFLTYMLIKNPISSIISAYMLNYDFLFILFTKLLSGFFTCIIHSAIVILILNLSLMFNQKGAVLEKYSFKGLFYGRKER